MNLRIEKELFQWEKNRFILVEISPNDPLVSHVQFYNKKTKTSPPESLIIDNKAVIPDLLLKDSLPIMALACSKDQVVCRREFKVLGRAKPDSYGDGEDTDIDIIYDGGVEI